MSTVDFCADLARVNILPLTNPERFDEHLFRITLYPAVVAKGDQTLGENQDEAPQRGWGALLRVRPWFGERPNPRNPLVAERA